MNFSNFLINIIIFLFFLCIYVFGGIIIMYESTKKIKYLEQLHYAAILIVLMSLLMWYCSLWYL